MWNEKYYLCKSPMTDCYVFVNERDYKYQRMHEAQLRVPDPKNDFVLLAQGTKKEMMLFKELAGDLTNVS